jgi:hypothetical protein
MAMLLAVLLLIIALATIPIMVGARIVKAEHTEFGRALIVAIVLAVFGMAIGKMVGNGFIAFVVQTAVGGWLIATFMGTTFLRGIAIGIIANVLQLLVVMVFAGAAIVAA